MARTGTPGPPLRTLRQASSPCAAMQRARAAKHAAEHSTTPCLSLLSHVRGVARALRLFKGSTVPRSTTGKACRSARTVCVRGTMGNAVTLRVWDASGAAVDGAGEALGNKNALSWRDTNSGAAEQLHHAQITAMHEVGMTRVHARPPGVPPGSKWSWMLDTLYGTTLSVYMLSL